MVPKNGNSITARSKVDESKTINDASRARANLRVGGPLAKSMTKTLTQSNMEAQSLSTPFSPQHQSNFLPLCWD